MVFVFYYGSRLSSILGTWSRCGVCFFLWVPGVGVVFCLFFALVDSSGESIVWHGDFFAFQLALLYVLLYVRKM